jgi:hypothetical protein
MFFAIGALYIYKNPVAKANTIITTHRTIFFRINILYQISRIKKLTTGHPYKFLSRLATEIFLYPKKRSCTDCVICGLRIAPNNAIADLIRRFFYKLAYIPIGICLFTRQNISGLCPGDVWRGIKLFLSAER